MTPKDVRVICAESYLVFQTKAVVVYTRRVIWLATMIAGRSCLKDGRRTPTRSKSMVSELSWAKSRARLAACLPQQSEALFLIDTKSFEPSPEMDFDNTTL